MAPTGGTKVHDLDAVTDRLARRRVGWPVPRDTYYWSRLRLDVAMRRSQRAAERYLLPAARALSDANARAALAVDGLNEVLLRERQP